jgi:hypothetical protein
VEINRNLLKRKNWLQAPKPVCSRNERINLAKQSVQVRKCFGKLGKRRKK